MNKLTTLSLLFVLSSPALAARVPGAANIGPAAQNVTARASKIAAARIPATPVGATKVLTDDQRAAIATKAVRKSIKESTSKVTKVTVSPTFVPFNGNARNPITGAGPIEIFVTQQRTYKPGLIGRIRAMFHPVAKQKYLVNVDKNGSAQILDRISLAPQRRLVRFFTNKLALGTRATDFFHSGKMTETLFTAAGATGAALVSPLLSGALFMRVAQVIGQGIASQNAVRKAAFDQTVAWAQNEGKGGSWPTLMNSYRAYQSNVEAEQQGAQPLGLGAFASALAVHNL